VTLEKSGKLKKTESWRMNGQNIEAVNTFKYLVSHRQAQEIGTNRKQKPKQNDIRLSQLWANAHWKPPYNGNMLENVC
jgi:hypothetical protein